MYQYRETAGCKCFSCRVRSFNRVYESLISVTIPFKWRRISVEKFRQRKYPKNMLIYAAVCHRTGAESMRAGTPCQGHDCARFNKLIPHRLQRVERN